jgi:serine/threonine protein kinase
MNEHRHSLQPGHRIQWYVVRDVLGQGGFGITYLAEDTNLDIQVAIKEYLPAEMAVREGDASVHPLTGEHGEQFRWGLERFISEAQTLARFKHPNIVRVFTVFTANNTAYMVMEYEQGRSLQDVLKERKILPELELRSMLLPLLSGLDQVHARGFIHRDIKPANIFMRGDGSAVLLDFGSARQSLGERTRTLTAMVSPGFAPFEQYAGKAERQGPWTDIYGLGATAYRAAVGRAPADAMDRSEALLRTSRDIFVGAVEINPAGYSSALLRAIDHALAFRTEDRPATIAAWRAELEGAAFSEEATVVVDPAPATRTPATLKITINADAVAEPAPRKGGRGGYWLAALAALLILFVLLAAIGKREAQPQPPATPTVDADRGGDAAEDAGKENVAAAAGPAPGSRDQDTPSPTKPQATKPEAGDTDATSRRERLANLQDRLRREPRSREAWEELREAIDEHERLARQAVRAGDYNAAEKYVLDMLKIAPNNRKLKEALDDVRKAKRGKPDRREKG